MTVKQISIILSDSKNKCGIYEKKLLILCKTRYDMQGLKATNYSNIRVQGGAQDNLLDSLIDKERALSKAVQEALINKVTAYENALKLIRLLPNTTKDCDILEELYLLNSSYKQISKKFLFDVYVLRNKVHIAKIKLARITEDKGLTFEDFYEKD